MSDTPTSLAGHEPSLHTVEMVCDRLAELGVAVGPDTARELVRAVLAAEAPRVDARLREALDTALETIRVAAQAAMGVLKTTSPAPAPAQPAPRPRPPEAAQPRRGRPTPVPEPRRPAASEPAPRHEPATPPRPRPDFDAEEPRPVFRRPRGR
ncbi:MAG TPA: hypothetical protein VFZ26_05680 [Gemmatimonadales bacterium]